jgi:hypothetical protein
LQEQACNLAQVVSVFIVDETHSVKRIASA